MLSGICRAMKVYVWILHLGIVHLVASQQINVTETSRLFPVIFNLAKDARISVNATCGETKNETYCRLVEHVPNHLEENFAQCRVCYALSPDPSERHPITQTIDGTGSWWQSPVLVNGLNYHYVTITLDLKQVFQVAYVIVKAANSPRPGNWILERSVNGIDYEPWQYYALSDHECMRLYGLQASGLMQRFKSDTQVVCTSYYSQLEPLYNGEIHTSIVNGRPSLKNPTPELMEFISARYVRLRFQRIRTLNADLMVDGIGKDGYMDPLVYRRYFYSIKDISIGGQCICYGHASACTQDPNAKPDEPVLKCRCEHNTCGESCNECCPFYHQKPWRPGSQIMGNRCEPCNCFGHTNECYYDEDVDSRHESLNIDGEYDGGGVCVNCQDNTMGINCETCIDGYFRPLGIEHLDPTPCKVCQCDPVGTWSNDDHPVSLCVKDDRTMFEGLNPGDCFCKEGYAGPNCDQCARGYKDYPLCTPCKCNLAGSLNEDVCEGPCVCKANVVGEKCDQCEDGYFNLAEDNIAGCTTCFCFGITTVCESIPWGIDKVTQMSGWFVTDLHTTAYLYPSVAGPNVISINHQKAMRIMEATNYYWFAPQVFLGNKLAAYGGNLQFTVSYHNRKQTPSPQPTKGIDIIIEGNRISLYQSFMVVLPNIEETVLIHMTERDWYRLSPNVDLNAGNNGVPATQEEFMSVLADINRLLIRATYSSNPEESRLKDVSLDVVSEDAIRDVDALTSVEQCDCPPTYEGLSCEECEYGYRRVGGRLRGGECQPCDCNNHAMGCDDHTGICYGCGHNTTGAHCEFCAPGYFGYASIGTPDDCQQCACPLLDPQNNFSPTCVADSAFVYVCDQCPTGYTGPHCDKCADGFYGNPLDPDNTCRSCSVVCNNNIDPAAVGNCNTLTGECLRCIGNTVGPRCDRCCVGYYGDAVNGQCLPCSCNPDGSINIHCNATSGQCDCKPDVEGIMCDTCAAGFWNLTASGCQRCECDPVGSWDGSCDVVTGQCACKPGVTGDKCDHCDFGHWNLGESGCQECDCEVTSGYCNPRTGECACPPNTARPKCDRCTDYAWGYDIADGCKMCNCNAVGSSGMGCDTVTGQCQCMKDYTGLKCDQCPFGYRKFPKCKKCKCNASGRDPTSCEGESCACEDNGQCFCKENVRGKKCTKCKPGTFSLQSKLPVGCTKCFCFGVTDICGEAGYMTEKLSLSSVDNDFVDSMGQRVKDSNEVMAVNQTMFWSLPENFLGNKLTSYGRSLKYAVELRVDDDSPATFSESPVDLKIFGTSHILVMNLTDSTRGKSRYKVELLEHNFLLQGAETARPPTRPEFMMVLQDIQLILIRAFDGIELTKPRLSGISMELAVAPDLAMSSRKALSIEMCQCPTGYAGLSCERCAPGYFRVSEGAYLGTCEPCTCSGHSDICDDSSGICENCQHHTAGDRCDVCEQGYYGDPSQGTPDDCRQCACPMVQPANNFSPECELAEDGMHNCTACQDGYTGRFCERCADGYFGNPTVPGGSCQPCLCNALGSDTLACNKTDGACNCLPGVAGHYCDECAERYVVSLDGCMSCDDNCTGLLLDLLDELADKLRMANLSGLLPAPWEDLFALENATEIVQMDLMKYTDQLDSVSMRIMPLLDDTSLTYDVQQLVAKANSTIDSAIIRAQDGMDTLKRAKKLEMNVTTLYADLRVSLAGLDDFFTGGNITIDESAALLLKAKEIVREIQSRNFMYNELMAQEELRLANATLQNLPSDHTKIIEELHMTVKRLRDFTGNVTELLQELMDLSSVANNMTDATNLLNQNSLKTVNDLREKTTITRNLEVDIKAELQFSNSLLSQGSSLIGNALTALGNISSELDSLREIQLNLDFDVSLLKQNMDGLSGKVEGAEAHARNLTQLAQYLDEVFGPTRDYAEDALKAAMAYADIVAAILNAMEAAQDAFTAANKAHDYVFANGTSLFTRAFMLLQKGLVLRHNASLLVGQVGDLNHRLLMVQGDLAMITGKSNEAERRLGELHQNIQKLPKGVSGDALRASDVAERAKAKAEKALADTKYLRAALPGLEDKMAEVIEHVDVYNKALDEADGSVKNTSSKVKEIAQLQSTLKSKAVDMENLEGTMAANLSDLRAKIRNARNQASKIRVALKSDGSCARSYKPRISPSAYNSLKMSVTIGKPDNSLFYIKSNTSEDFLHLETINGQLMFFWNVGSGVGMVSHPSILMTNTSYMIEVERFGNTASVTVRTSPAADGVTATDSSDPSSSILDVDETSTLFVAGIPSTYNDMIGVKAFHGCMSDVMFDNKFIGIWNFLTVEGNCTGCNVKIETDQNAKEFVSFDGTGYSNLERPDHWLPTKFSVEFGMKTFAEEALLYFMASDDQVDFQSIEIVGGYLILKHNCGSGTGHFASTDKVNNGEWIDIKVTRTNRDSTLYINGIVKGAATSPGELDQMQVEPGRNLYVGGIRRGLEIKPELAITTKSYLGCLRKLLFFRETKKLIEPGYSIGVSEGCSNQAIRNVGLFGDGYVALHNFALPHKARLSFTFASKQEDAVLLSAGQFRGAGRRRKDVDSDLTDISYSISLYKGRVQAQVNAGQGELTLVSRKSDGLFNDGHPHVIQLMKDNLFVRMTVDDTIMRGGNLPGSESLVGVNSLLYIGGIGPNVIISEKIANLPAFSGCIENLIIEGSVIDFAKADNFEGADLGLCGPLILPPATTGMPTTTDLGPLVTATPDSGNLGRLAPANFVIASTNHTLLESCYRAGEPDIIEGGMRFGVMPDSHVEVDVQPDSVSKLFQVEIELRTRVQNGLVFFISDGKDGDFCTLQIMKGFVLFMFDNGAGPSTILTDFEIADGHWHTIEATRNRKTGMLIVDTQPKQRHKAVWGPNNMKVKSPLYIGGLPGSFQTGEISEVDLPEHNGTEESRNSFSGCIRKFVLNGERVDLSSAEMTKDVSPCYTNTEPGAYFMGTGYAVLETKLDIGSNLEVRLGFRTTQEDGILLAAGNTAQNSLVLELAEGKILLRLRGMELKREFVQAFTICNNQWHVLVLRTGATWVELMVDGEMQRQSSDGALPNLRDSIHMLYIGGNPVDSGGTAITATTTPFKGCLRDVQLNGASISSFSSLPMLHGVVPDQCPIV